MVASSWCPPLLLPVLASPSLLAHVLVDLNGYDDIQAPPKYKMITLLYINTFKTYLALHCCQPLIGIGQHIPCSLADRALRKRALAPHEFHLRAIIKCSPECLNRSIKIWVGCLKLPLEIRHREEWDYSYKRLCAVVDRQQIALCLGIMTNIALLQIHQKNSIYCEKLLP